MGGRHVPKGTKSRGFLVRYIHFQPDFNKIRECAKRYKKVAKREKVRGWGRPEGSLLDDKRNEIAAVHGQ